MAIKHKHHILPKYLGGTDDKENLVELTVEEHAAAHLNLYKKFGNKEDICAFHMLSGDIEEFRKEYAYLGGKAIQKIRKENNLTSYGLIPGSEEQKQHASLGGKIQGKRNVESGHLTRISLLPRKYKKKFWITDGKVSKLFYPENNEKIPDGFVKGRTILNSRKKIWITDGKISKLIMEGEEIPNGYAKGRAKTKKD